MTVAKDRSAKGKVILAIVVATLLLITHSGFGSKTPLLVGTLSVLVSLISVKLKVDVLYTVGVSVTAIIILMSFLGFFG